MTFEISGIFNNFRLTNLLKLGNGPAILVAGFFLCSGLIAQTTVGKDAPETIFVDQAPDQEVIAVAKTIVVRGDAKGVLVFGGDIVIEGDVSGDVAAIGGSVIQKESGKIRGDIFVIGGSYRPEAREPLRGKSRETLVYAGYEQELREYSRNPSSLFAPGFSWSFLIQRIFSLLFWFTVGFLVTLISPGAIRRAATRFKIAPVSVFAAGAAGFVLITVAVITSVGIFPGFISGILGLMAFMLLILTYVFGRSVLQVSVGKWFIKLIAPHRKPSDTLSIIIGAVFWTLILSLPFVWVPALFLMFSVSVGLVLTARKSTDWKAA